MTFDASLPTATDRVRLFVGDTGTTSLMPGGATTYAALAALYSADEAGYAVAVAKMLRAGLALEPTSVGSGGETVAWSNRLKHLDDIISGASRYPFASGAASTGIRGLYVGGRTLTPMFTRDSLGTDPTLNEGAADAD